MTHLDLFSGIGGFAHAAKWAGLETIYFVEKNEACRKILADDFPDVPIWSDVKTFDAKNLKNVFLLTAGFPCQPFSNLGLKKGQYDERWLFGEIIRILGECRPAWIILENVERFSRVPEFEICRTLLEGIGYRICPRIIPADSVGAPQIRERIWIVGHSDGEIDVPREEIFRTRGTAEKSAGIVDGIRKAWLEDPLESIAGILRLPDGFSPRYTNAQLGNAVVPMIPYELIRIILSTYL